ncbi:lipoprotein NlpI [Pseudidiomarina sp.]|uniref:lipoprotein NlpI n=1 Tax=Pseudidiomarina sp. TaxID=2081707 RepID=UPI00299EBC0E|nr:lipoprotein NlpI [Pseudidiomarina sp.]MDX1705066.1 lipoprotein NlpI [Pseudidiomarina sp.]
MKIKPLAAALAGVLLLLLQGCMIAPQEQPEDALKNLFVVAPQPPELRYQLEVAKLSQVIAEEQLSAETMAELLYRRGALYDGLGMTALARIDFNHALEYQPRLADAYNYLGIHFTQAAQFDYAFEAYEATLELDPDHPYAHLNRGVAAYYDSRFDLAVDDLLYYFEQSPADPYRVLWLYLAEVELDREQARINLAQRRIAHGGDEWGWVLSDLMLGAISPVDFIDRHAARDLREDETLAERMCEAYFYLGKHQQLAGQHKLATVYFRLALTTSVYMFLEHRYAGLELERSMAVVGQDE